MVRKVEVIPYDAAWVKKFLEERLQLLAILDANVVSIDHIGSTAIPDMPAKPVIDILISVIKINTVDAYNDKMVTFGYEIKGEFGIVGRRFFLKNVNGERSYHVHIFQHGNPELQRHIKFRDYMITHPAEAAQYAELKIKLAQLFPDNITAYCEGKNNFIKEIDQKSKIS